MINLGIKDIKELTAAMSEYPYMDYSNYALSFLKRRLPYIFHKLKIKKTDPFINSLKNEAFRNKVISLMCVEITEMFRDPAFWRTLRSKILPEMPKESNTIWFPMETSGEEAISMAVLLHENKLVDKYKILCHNPSPLICENIKNGKITIRHNDINQTNYRRLEENDSFNDYFTQQNGYMILNDGLKNNINCYRKTFLCDPESDKIGCILFRNNSIYYNHKMAESSFKLLIDKLMPGGFLAIGIKEKLPKSIEESLIVIDQTERIYQKPNVKLNSYYAKYESFI